MFAQRPRTRTQKLLVGGALGLCCLVLLELGLRAFEPGPFSWLDTNAYEPDAVLHHVHRPNFQGRWDGSWYQINSTGQRGPELPAPRTSAASQDLAGTEQPLRIMALGDSGTFGKGVLEAGTWPRLLENLLAQQLAGPSAPTSVHVANYGVNGYSPDDYLECFERYSQAFEPDLVVLGLSLNDFPNTLWQADSGVYRSEGNLRDRLPRGLLNQLGRFALFRELRQRYYEARGADRQRAFDRWAQREAFLMDQEYAQREWARQCLARLAQKVHKAGAPLFVFLVPYETQVESEHPDTRPGAWIQTVCHDMGAVFVDTLSAFREHSSGPNRLFLRGDRYHPSSHGYRVLAGSLIQEISLTLAD